MSAQQTRARAGRGFVTATAVLGWALAAASAPSPLYAVYAERWQFGAGTLTAVFAVYAVSLLAALLVFGSLSDSVGRRPVILAGLVVLGASMVLFLLADGVTWLFAARIVQGVGTGLVTAGVAAALIDLQPVDRPGFGALVNAVTPTAGLAIGAVAAGGLVQYAGQPLRLVYALLLGGFVVLALVVAAGPESSPDRRPVQLRPRVRVEPQAAGVFLAVLPCLVATWALGGLYLSLGPSLVLSIAHSTNRLLGGSAVFALCAAGAGACLVAARWSPARATRTGCALLVGGLLVTIPAVLGASLTALFAGTVLAGAGFGMGFLGAFRAVLAQAGPTGRGSLVAAVYVVAYLAFSVPAVAAGLVSGHLGLRPTTVGYAGLLVLLALVPLVTGTARDGSRRSPADPARG